MAGGTLNFLKPFNICQFLIQLGLAWLAMTNEQRAKSLVIFFKYQNQSKFQSSMDDLLTITATNKIAKQLQIKRFRTAKTRTIPNFKKKPEAPWGLLRYFFRQFDCFQFYLT